MTTSSQTVGWHNLFGPHPVLEGEDPETFEQLFGRVCAATKPVDAVDELFVYDVVCHEWEAVRWLRAKAILVRTHTRKALHQFLTKQLDYSHYEELFQNDLAEILRDIVPPSRQGTAAALAAACARNEPAAVAEVTKILADVKDTIDNRLDDAQARKASELLSKYRQHDPAAENLVDGLLAAAGKSIHDLMLEALTGQLDCIERIDRLVCLAKSRRDASLREIDRRRAVLGEKLRKSLEESQTDLIESTAQEA